MQPARRPWHGAALHLWPVALAVVLVWPLLTEGGYPLARDLIFVPQHSWTPQTVGLGDGAPRAVPLDAVVAALTTLIDGALVARVVLPLVLAVAGWGVLRLLANGGVAARLAGSGLAVWNPFVVERLALGQWALLAGYAALPWLVLAAARYRRHGSGRDLGRSILWAAFASLTPTGGLLAVAGLAAGGWETSRRWVTLMAAGILLQGPWVVAALVGPAVTTSDPDAVATFAPDTDAPGGVMVALLGLGGIWDDASEPATRGTWLALVAAAAMIAIVAMGHRGVGTFLGAEAHRRWLVLAATGAVLAVASATPWGQDLMRAAVSAVPGAGLLRDGQKFLAPVVILAAVSLGAVTERLSSAWGRHSLELRISALLPLVAAPVVLLPDATTVTWPTVNPVAYPRDFETVATEVALDPDDAVLVTLPWRSYRRFEWGNDQTASDPALRWFEADVRVSDDLQVGPVLVEGENPAAAAIGAALETGTPAQVLGPRGVTWVVVYPDDPAADDLDVAGLEVVYPGEDVALYRVPEPASRPAVATGPRAAVATGWLVALGMLLGGTVLIARERMATLVSARR